MCLRQDLHIKYLASNVSMTHMDGTGLEIWENKDHDKEEKQISLTWMQGTCQTDRSIIKAVSIAADSPGLQRVFQGLD